MTPTTSTRPTHGRVDFDERPMLVFWEVTRACLLACRHCRASATAEALPGELTLGEGIALIDQVAGFGRPHPILILTGGDCLLRPDIFELVEHANSLGVPVGLSPSVTPMLTRSAIARMLELGVKAVSLSLDGAQAGTHDTIRGIPGHFDRTLEQLRALVDAGLKVQVNTTVMRENADELADIAAIVARTGVQMWEVFFLVHVGRGQATGAITPDEHEQVCRFLFDASHHGFVVRTVEAPFFRRVVAQRLAGTSTVDGSLYGRLSSRLQELLGQGGERASAHTAATRDGKGIVFVAYDGTVFPAGFLPIELGSVRDQTLAEIYRDDPLLKRIRSAEFSGRCGACEYSDVCGGSRARAYASHGDPLASDDACVHVPFP